MEVCKEHTIFFSFSCLYFCFFCVFRIILWFFVFSSCAYFADGCFWHVLLRANTQMSLYERHRFHTGTSALIRLYSYYKYFLFAYRESTFSAIATASRIQSGQLRKTTPVSSPFNSLQTSAWFFSANCLVISLVS